MVARRFRLLYSLLATLCSSLFFVALFSSTVHAASHTPKAQNPITIISQTYTLNFPTSIDFRVTARDSQSSINNATILITSPAPHFFSDAQNVTIAQAASTVTLTWHEEIKKGGNFLPSGTRLSYYWQFSDSTGMYHEPEQTLTITDTRFPWQQLTQDMVQVHWYNRSTDFGQTVLTQALTSMQRIDANLGGRPSSPVDLWVYQTENDFRGSLPPDAYEWVGGIAFVDLNQALIVVKDNEDDTLIRDMPHELTHLVFHQLISRGIYAPTWFDEGLAVYNQNYQEPDMTIRFKQALAAHTLLYFSTLYTSFPNTADQAYIAYAQSWQFVRYLYNTFGINKMATLIKSMNTKQISFADDVKHNLGADPLQLENQWRSSLGQSAISLPTAQNTTTSVSDRSQLPSLVDSNAPFYLFLGGLLIILPAGGLLALFTHQRRSRQSKQQAAQMLPILGAPYGPPIQPPTPINPPNFVYPGSYPREYSSPYSPQSPYPPKQPSQE